MERIEDRLARLLAEKHREKLAARVEEFGLFDFLKRKKSPKLQPISHVEPAYEPGGFGEAFLKPPAEAIHRQNESAPDPKQTHCDDLSKRRFELIEAGASKDPGTYKRLQAVENEQDSLGCARKGSERITKPVDEKLECPAGDHYVEPTGCVSDNPRATPTPSGGGGTYAPPSGGGGSSPCSGCWGNHTCVKGRSSADGHCIK